MAGDRHPQMRVGGVIARAGGRRGARGRRPRRRAAGADPAGRGSGARLMTTLVHHMRAERHCYGLQTMCERDGQANATILELL